MCRGDRGKIACECEADLFTSRDAVNYDPDQEGCKEDTHGPGSHQFIQPGICPDSIGSKSLC